MEKKSKPSENIAKDVVKELIKLLELRQKEVTVNTLYSEGKIDGLNIAIRELEKFLSL